GFFYLDNSPTIGAKNDSKGATASIRIFLKDAAGKPAANFLFSTITNHMEFYSTDSTGHFQSENCLASKYSFYFGNNGKFKYLDIIVQPGEVKEVEFQLDWVLPDNTQIQGVEAHDGLGEMKYSLSQNYPNPFNPATSISYSIEKAGPVKILVYDLLGNKIATIVNEFQNAGTHKVSFDATGLTSGVYLYTIESGSFRSTRKMTLMK
ncbi:MAG: T9SS type A sorting domain-containing protein, partial [Ignavibacteria bacterium]|nr:T9SS type A sorting domain-containing protein [Ignavibacteria bacterium]